jgi:ribosomal protein S18 acetylase RimI-like enzyme
METLIQEIEESTFRGWPALAVRSYDGWALRFADGLTRRANSISPMYGGEHDLDFKIEICERLYDEADLPTIFKMTPVSQPESLEAELDARGYRRSDPIRVQTCTLDGDYTPDDSAHLSRTPSPDWTQAFYDLSETPHPQRALKTRLLELIRPASVYARIVHDDRVIACGRAVHDGRYLGIYDVVVSAEYRRTGWGLRLMHTLMAWGQAQGAEVAYLQVTADNDAAFKLYQTLGFETAYEYWYRIKDG